MKAPVKKPPAAKSTTKAAVRSGTNPIEPVDERWKRISKKAYELWEQRGHREGYALQDWLDEKAALKEETHETRN